jgi:O-antigen ligase/Flp pilus assembly protein TadD
MKRRITILLTGLLFFWIPLAHFYPSVDAFLGPKDLLGLVICGLLISFTVFQAPVLYRQTWVRVLLAFILWMAADGFVVGYSPLSVERGAFHFILWFGTVAGVLLLGDGERTLEKMAAFVLAAGSFMALHGLFQTMGFHEADFTTRFESRAFSTLGNPDYLGGFLAALLPLAWVMTLRARTPAGWWTLRAITLLLFAGVLATRTRGSFLALAGAGLFIALALVLPWGRNLWKENKGFVLATVLIAVTGAGAFWVRHGGLSAFGLGQASIQQRLDLWRIAGAMVKDHPWTGVGLGHFALQFPAYQAKPWAGGHPYIYSSHVHNEFIQFLTEGGVIGLLLFVAVLGFFSWQVFRYSSDPSSPESGRTFLIGVGGGMVSLLVQSLTNFPLQVAPTAVLFGFFLAAPWALQKKEPSAPPLRRGGIGSVVALTVFFITGVWVAREMAASIALRDCVGETGLGNGTKAVYFGARALSLSPSDPKVWSANAKAHRILGQGAEALSDLQKSIALDPNDVEDREMAAEILLGAGHPQEAVKFCQAAQAIAPNDLGVLWTLGVSEFQTGNFQEAAQTFERYAAGSPNEYQTFLNLGVCYMRLGQPDKAKAAWERAKALNPSDPQLDQYLKSLNHRTK